MLLCENPTQTGVLSVTLHPGLSFGSEGTRDLILGSHDFVERNRALVKRVRYIDAKLCAEKDVAGDGERAMLEQERDDAMATIEQLKDKISDNRVAAFVPLVGAGVCGEHCRLTLQDVTEQGGVASRAEGDGAQVRASDGGRARVRDGLVAVVREQRGGEG